MYERPDAPHTKAGRVKQVSAGRVEVVSPDWTLVSGNGTRSTATSSTPRLGSYLASLTARLHDD